MYKRSTWFENLFVSFVLLFTGGYAHGDSPPPSTGLRVGAAAVELEADDSMVIAGGIHAGKANEQEGKLRCVAVVLEKSPTKLAIAACDVLMLTRKTLDPVVAEVEKATGIPEANILINCTHTHHAPSTMCVHDYGPDEVFTRRVQQGVVKAVKDANARLAESRFYFHLGEERTVGQNSRQLLDDGMIHWIGATNHVRATGPFDPELPLLAFKDETNKLRALIFNHSTHTIGARMPGKRSPSFYGLAAQELEKQFGGIACFLEGASGSTHNLELTADECTKRIKVAVSEALNKAQPREVGELAALKRPVKFRVRQFNEAAEEEAVTRYCRKYDRLPAKSRRLQTRRLSSLDRFTQLRRTRHRRAHGRLGSGDVERTGAIVRPTRSVVSLTQDFQTTHQSPTLWKFDL